MTTEKPDPAALTKDERFMLEWLLKDDGQYGEMRGKTIDGLLERGLVRWRDVKPNDFAVVTLTDAGRATLTAEALD